jgi:Holliday junction DNA helicase RuvA
MPDNDYTPAVDGIREEAVAALTMLGFAAAPATKVVNQILQQQPAATVEQVIKAALKML